jgi:hypothetical protein
MLIRGIAAIRAGVPDKHMRETVEYTQVRQKGYKSRKRRLRIRLFVSLGLLIGLTAAAVWSVKELVHDLASAPYNFASGQVETAWWPPIAALLTVGGTVVALVVWLGTLRRLKALEAARRYAE